MYQDAPKKKSNVNGASIETGDKVQAYGALACDDDEGLEHESPPTRPWRGTLKFGMVLAFLAIASTAAVFAFTSPAENFNINVAKDVAMHLHPELGGCYDSNAASTKVAEDPTLEMEYENEYNSGPWSKYYGIDPPSSSACDKYKDNKKDCPGKQDVKESAGKQDFRADVVCCACGGGVTPKDCTCANGTPTVDTRGGGVYPPTSAIGSYIRHFVYAPVDDINGQGRTTETSAAECQKRCNRVSGCSYFAFHDDGGCHLSSSAAKKKYTYSGVTSGLKSGTLCYGQEDCSACDTGYTLVDMQCKLTSTPPFLAEWEQQTKKECWDEHFGPEYDTLALAKAACMFNDDCKRIFNDRCKTNGRYWMCYDAPLRDSVYRKKENGHFVDGSCVYNKPTDFCYDIDTENCWYIPASESKWRTNDCGDDDDETWKAAELCCACGGGRRGCVAGYTLSEPAASGSAQTCVDINECDLGTDNCDANEFCGNTDGSFVCEAKCVGNPATYDAGYGNCSTYEVGHTWENYDWCAKDEDACAGGVAKDVCSECGACKRTDSSRGRPSPPKLTTCVSDPAAFDAGWGDCSTYKKGIVNYGFCASDKDTKCQAANSVCPQCGVCKAKT